MSFEAAVIVPQTVFEKCIDGRTRPSSSLVSSGCIKNDTKTIESSECKLTRNIFKPCKKGKKKGKIESNWISL